MTGLSIQLFGSYKFTWHGQPVAGLRSVRAAGLLAYLACQPGRAHSRSALAGLLWGEYSEEDAQASLRVVLSNLRQVLRRTCGTDAERLLSIERREVTFHPVTGLVWTDAIVFDTLMTACRLHSHAALVDCSVCLARLEQAAALYQGNFLADLSFPDSPAFDEWRLLQQENAHQQALLALDALGRHALADGNPGQAQEYARQQIRLEPWREEAHRQLMRALASSGQPGAALDQYAACRRLLADEMGVEPAPETRALYMEIKNRHGGKAANAPVEQPRPSNLPAQMTAFVGRENELGRVVAKLIDPTCRLLTLVGPGGIGKTRLALQAAMQINAGRSGEFADGVFLVPLEEIDTPAGIVARLASILGLAPDSPGNDGAGVREYPRNNAPEDAAPLLAALQARSMLLLLDNCEQALANPHVPGLLSEILRAAGGLKLLVTSRERTRIQAEWLFEVDGLEYPVEGENEICAETRSAVHLFVQSARRALPEFTCDGHSGPGVAQICRTLAGMPLGIELAAAWVPLFSTEEIARQIEVSLDFLDNHALDVPERQRSLRAAFESSWQRLSEAEQRAFRRLSVFLGSFDRLSAVQVAELALPLLLGLVSKSLVRPQSSGRLSVHPVLRGYALEKLRASGEEETYRARHARQFLTLAARLEADLRGGDQPEALRKLATDIENVRAAWEWAAMRGEFALIGDGLRSLFHFYDMRSRFAEGEAAFHTAVEALRQAGTGPYVSVITALCQARRGWFAFHLGRSQSALEDLRQAQSTLEQAVGNTGSAQPLPGQGLDIRYELAFCLNYQAAIYRHLGDLERAERIAQESLALCRVCGDRYGASIALNIQAQVALLQGHMTQAADLCLKGLSIKREIGDRWGSTYALTYLGQMMLDQNEPQRASGLFQESLAIYQEMGDQRGIAFSHHNLGSLAEALGNQAEANRQYQHALEIFNEIGSLTGALNAWMALMRLQAAAGDFQAARHACRQALDSAAAMKAEGALRSVLQSAAELLEQASQPARAVQARALQANWASGEPLPSGLLLALELELA